MSSQRPARPANLQHFAQSDTMGTGRVHACNPGRRALRRDSSTNPAEVTCTRCQRTARYRAAASLAHAEVTR